MVLVQSDMTPQTHGANYSFPLQGDDYIVMGTDGLFDNLSSTFIAKRLKLLTKVHHPSLSDPGPRENPSVLLLPCFSVGGCLHPFLPHNERAPCPHVVDWQASQGQTFFKGALVLVPTLAIFFCISVFLFLGQAARPHLSFSRLTSFFLFRIQQGFQFLNVIFLLWVIP